MEFFNNILEFIKVLSTQISLELFVLIGSFVEEIFAPIPSPLVMTLAGSLAHAQGQKIIYLAWIAIIGAVGKTFGAWILYLFADKLEDVVIGRFGKFFGFSHKEVEQIGKRLNGSWKDNVVLFVIRAIPIVPSAPVSLACGIIKLNKKTYITSTFLGTMVRNLIYLYLGYAGLSSYEQVLKGFERAESIVQILLFVIVSGMIMWMYWRRRTSIKRNIVKSEN